MQDAYNLIWKLALVIRGQAGDALLDSYEQEREPVSDQVIEGSSAIHEIILAHGSGLEDRMALTQSDGWNDKAVARISGLSYNYCDVQPVPPGSRTDVSPAPGERVPDVEVSDHVRLHRLMAHTRFTLLIVMDQADGTQLDLATQLAAAMDADFPGLARTELVAPQTPHPWPGVLPIEDPQGRIAEAINANAGGEYMLIRPDGYVACRAPLSEQNVAHDFLRTILS